VTHTCVPAEFSESPFSPLTQQALIDPASVSRISVDNWLANYKLLKRDSSAGYFLDGGAREGSFGSLDEQLFIGVVAGESLVVELDEIEIDHGANSLVNSTITTVFIESTREIGALRSMSQNGVGRYFSVSLGEVNQPLLASTCVHSSVVLPISIGSIKIVVNDKLSKVSSTSSGIQASSSRPFSSSESTHQNLNAIIVEFLSEKFLKSLSGRS
jgi:hypothetical protein